MKFEQVSKLREAELLEGLGILYNNAISLFKTGRVLSESKQYGHAVALTVLSVEELIKANALFLILIEVGSEELFNSAFDSKNLHKSRLKVAEGLTISHGLVDKHQVIKSIEKASESIEFDLSKVPLEEILKMKWVEEFMSKFYESQEMKQEIEKIKVMGEGASAKLSEHTSWFFNAQKQKENGMYCDFINGKWHSPLNISEDVFIKANSHANLLFENIGNPIKTLIETPSIGRNILLALIRTSVAQIKNNSIS